MEMIVLWDSNEETVHITIDDTDSLVAYRTNTGVKFKGAQRITDNALFDIITDLCTKLLDLSKRD